MRIHAHVESTSVCTLSHEVGRLFPYIGLVQAEQCLTLGTDPLDGVTLGRGAAQGTVGCLDRPWPLCTRGHSTHPGVSIWDSGEPRFTSPAPLQNGVPTPARSFSGSPPGARSNPSAILFSSLLNTFLLWPPGLRPFPELITKTHLSDQLHC